ncbi:hypothetical protein M569_15755 [Genlisea aurea]|uniref:Uncharacterized protein n=1 Tax=Genlisea aurea TaxID=192259 RepID=S8BWS3_9LAMI|nr:hypothetical protein M569_15755 [Genlisea aurea]
MRHNLVQGALSHAALLLPRLSDAALLPPRLSDAALLDAALLPPSRLGAPDCGRKLGRARRKLGSGFAGLRAKISGG